MDFCPAFCRILKLNGNVPGVNLAVHGFLQDIEQRIPVMDAQYKIITKTAHLVTKESPQEEAKEVFATMSGLKEQLTKVGEYFMQVTLQETSAASCAPYLLVTEGKSFTC